jgi:hypothetical protein
MADRCLLITWGQVARGREERALENFNEAMGYYGRCQQEGKIEGFDVVLCAPNAKLDGYIQLRGAARQLADLKEEAEYQRLLVTASLCTDELSVIEAACNEGVAEQVEIFAQAVAKVPQMA